MNSIRLTDIGNCALDFAFKIKQQISRIAKKIAAIAKCLFAQHRGKVRPLEERDFTFNEAKELAKKCSEAVNRRGALCGQNGAVLLYHPDEKDKHVPIGVFKREFERKFWVNPKEYMKLWVGQRRLLNNKKGMEQYAEVAAAKLNKALNWDLTPDAEIIKIGHQKGAFISYLGGYKELADVRHTLINQNFSCEELDKWQKACIFSFLIGQQDAHGGNIFVKIKDGKLKDVKLIDFGNAFNVRTIGRVARFLGFVGNEGAYGRHSISQIKFTKTSKNLVTEKMDSTFRQWKNGLKRDFLTPGMEKLLDRRWKVLRYGISKGVVKSPADLAEIHTLRDLKRVENKLAQD